MMLGFGAYGPPHAYALRADPGRVYRAINDNASAVVGRCIHSKRSESRLTLPSTPILMERAKGLEPSTFSLGS